MQVRFTFALAAALTLAAPLSSQAQDAVADFYKNKQMTLMIGSGPGGGYDTLGRAVARHYGRLIPGNPSFIVQNMPGAGSITMTRHVYTIAPKDGSVIGVGNNAMPTAPLLYPDQAKFDATKISWIGGPSRDAMVVMVWHTAPVQSIEELFTKELIVGGSGRGSAPVDYALMANEVLGTKFKLISGYNGTGALDLAMERGEVQGNAGLGWVSAKVRNTELIAAGKAKIIAQYGFKQHPDLPNVPLFKVPDNAADQQLLSILYARDESGRPFFGPPGIPADRLKALRTAFQAMLKDKGFLDDAKKLDLVIEPVSGEELDALAKKLSETSPAAAERARKILNN
jgi:tripartite-type tricarboxylate transporter receptor subunit TctC